MSKYHNKKISTAQGEYDSKLEMQRHLYLLGLQEKGLIRNLQRQVEFELIPRQTRTELVRLKTKWKEKEVFKEHPVSYIADFTYEKRLRIEDGTMTMCGWEPVVEDTKGQSTGRWSSQTPDFRIKKKLMLYIHNIEVRIVTKATQEI